MTILAERVQNTVAEMGDVIPMQTADTFASEAGWLDFTRCNLLDQVRKTYTGIEDLAQDFSVKGMFHPVQVAYLTRARAERHLAMVNLVWDTEITLKDLIVYSTRPERYAIVITGHRRTLAHLELWYRGCQVCRDVYGEEAPGICRGRHPYLHRNHPVEEMSCTVYKRIPPDLAMSIQCTENMHEKPIPHEQADAYERLYIIRSVQDPTLTLTQFARDVGCDPDTVRRARRYCRLHPSIKAEVEAGRLSFGMGLELGRLQERLGLNDETVQAERDRILVNKLTVVQFRRTNDELIRKAQSGEGAMFGIGSLVAEEQPQRRAVFERQMLGGLYGFAAYLRRAKPLLEDGRIGRSGQYLDTSTRRVVGETVLALEEVLQDLRLRRAELERTQQVITDIRAEMATIETLEHPPAELTLLAEAE